jgi:small subunit ribosomal protein S2
MRGFIYGERNGIHVIDLRKTQILMDVAHDAAQEIASRGHRFLFVGTKKQAKTSIAEQAKHAGAYYVNDRWLGGMLTNFITVRKSIKRLEGIEKMEADGTMAKLRKKERLIISREKDKLVRVFGGIRDMVRLPQALFIVDIRREHLAIKEAKKLGIPTFAIVDTNCDPHDVDFPIPANDDSIRTVELITSIMAQALKGGKQLANVRAMDMASAADKGEVDVNIQAEEQPRRKRSRRPKRAEKPAETTTEATAPAEAAPEAPSTDS